MNKEYTFTGDYIEVIDEYGVETFREPYKHIDTILSKENLIEYIEKEIENHTKKIQKCQEKDKFKSLFCKNFLISASFSLLAAVLSAPTITAYLIIFIVSFIVLRLADTLISHYSIKNQIKEEQKMIDYKQKKIQEIQDEIKRLEEDNDVAYFMPCQTVSVSNEEKLKYLCDSLETLLKKLAPREPKPKTKARKK